MAKTYSYVAKTCSYVDKTYIYKIHRANLCFSFLFSLYYSLFSVIRVLNGCAVPVACLYC